LFLLLLCSEQHGKMEATQIYHRGRFTEVYVLNPASSSDFIAFLRSSFNQPGYLANGLALFDDNAYVSTNYMVTPYKNIGAGVKDEFNFFQSQVRINIECAFGMLGWSIAGQF
jgi:hypothetical protein